MLFMRSRNLRGVHYDRFHSAAGHQCSEDCATRMPLDAARGTRHVTVKSLQYVVFNKAPVKILLFPSP